jgi:hypothetical protein
VANENNIEILKQGAEQWNEWRRDGGGSLSGSDSAYLRTVGLANADLHGVDFKHLDLSGAILSDADLSGASFTGANLSFANLNGSCLNGAFFYDTILRHAHLRGADLSCAILSDTNLRGADLADAVLKGADLYAADLSEADLRRADISFSNLRGASLNGANMSGAKVNHAVAIATQFVNLNLREVEGLDVIEHRGPSEVSVSSLALSNGEIPEIFLRGCGLDNWEIEAAKIYRPGLSIHQYSEITYKIIELRSDPLIQFYSCFISYSSKDEEFAKHLFTDLQNSGVRCWFAPEHMKIGDRIRRRIDESIQLHDKLLLILSQSSVDSLWIEQEVATALEKEREQGYEVLFPIRLDDSVMNLRSDWPALIRNTRHIGDFRQWEDPNEYQKVFARLISDLREKP